MHGLTPTLALLLSLSSVLAYTPVSRSQRQRRGDQPLSLPSLEKRRYVSYNEKQICVESWNPTGLSQCAHHMLGAVLHCRCCPSSDEAECREKLTPPYEKRSEDEEEGEAIRENFNPQYEKRDEEEEEGETTLVKRKGYKERYVDCESGANPEGWAVCPSGDTSCQCMNWADKGSHGKGQWSTGDRKIGPHIDRYVKWWPKHPEEHKWKHWGPGATIGTNQREEAIHDKDGNLITHDVVLASEEGLGGDEEEEEEEYVTKGY